MSVEEGSGKNWFRAHPWATVGLGVLLLLLLVLVWLWFKPFKLVEIPLPQPAASFDEAIARIEAVQAAEDARGDLNDICHTQFLSHGEQTEHAIVLLHGFTSCPDQFLQLGQAFYERGYNVYIPRLPHHGIADLMTEDLINLTAEEMAAFAMEAADVAQGLGESVTVSGLSGGGTMAVYLAQLRDDVYLAAPIAPFVGIGFIPAIFNRPLTNFMLTAPNFWMWWDPRAKQDNPVAAPYSYRRYPTHALGEVLRLGFSVEQEARETKPLSPDIIMVSNASDQSVNNNIIDEFVSTWAAHGAEVVETFRFDRSFGLPHDIITPTRPNAQIDVVYPVLLDLLAPDGE